MIGNRPRSVANDITTVARPWVYFLWVPALVYPGALAYRDIGMSLSLRLYGLCFVGVFSAMLVQHFLHVAGGSSSTITTGLSQSTLYRLAAVSGLPLLIIVGYFTLLRGLAVVGLFVIAGLCLVGYAIPAAKSEWYWGLGQGVVSIGTYYVLVGDMTPGLGIGAVSIACLYYNMLHSARLAEGDYADAIGKAQKGYYIQRYAFFVGATLFPISFVL